MPWISVDCETDGDCPGIYSMVQIGAVFVDKEGKFEQTFFGKLKPISDTFRLSALESFGCTREETLTYDDPLYIMKQFESWLHDISGDKFPIFIADNNGFDWQFVNYYFWRYLGYNPFGYSSTNLGSLYKGIVKNMYKNFKYLRKTKHTHNPVDDAKGNAEAFYYMINKMGLVVNL